MKTHRVICLVPSLSELLVDLGLDEFLIGVTKFCVHPQHLLKEKAIIGGTKTLDIPKIEALEPTLIIANKEENQKKQIIELTKKHSLWLTDIKTLDDVYQLIEEIGQHFDIQTIASKMIFDIKSKWQAFEALKTPKTCLYFIWRKPYMSVGSSTFIAHLIEKIGFRHLPLASDTNYPEISEETLTTLAPDVVFLSSEPYAFKEKHRSEFQAFFPKSTIVLVDGEMFSWYGSRQVKAVDYFQDVCFDIQN
ncbi:MAG: ABC transporter substrate-binding protein [Flavobacteriales bacterium]